MSASIESVIASLGTGLVVLAIGLLIPKKRVPRMVVVLLSIGVALIAFVVWPKPDLVSVPDLSDLSRDQADEKLASCSLVGVAQPQDAPTTRPEHVIAQSQTPLPGTMVKRHTLVRYSVSTGSSLSLLGTQAAGGVPIDAVVAIFAPRNGENVAPRRGADNIFRLDVEGTFGGADPTQFTILLWVQPIQPPSDEPGWYLQRRPNGILSISGNRWRGVCQIGNSGYPPHGGDMVNVVASIVPAEEALRLDARQGPFTSVIVPGVASDVVTVTINLK